MKPAATRLVEEVHARMVERVEAQGTSIAEYLENLVLADLAGGGDANSSAEEGSEAPSPEAGAARSNEQHAELLALIHKLGELTFLTRASFFNFVLLWARLEAGDLDPKKFDWRTWCEEQLSPKGK